MLAGTLSVAAIPTMTITSVPGLSDVVRASAHFGLCYSRRMKLVENICLGMQHRGQTNNTDVLTYSPAPADIASRHQQAGCVIDYCNYNQTRRSCVEVRFS